MMSHRNLLYVFKISIITLSITFCIDKIIFFILNKTSDHIYSGQGVGKLNHFLKIKDEKDLLIFGSSRANHNINPDIITKNGFNMGVDGRGLAFVYPLVELVKENKKKQLILIQIDTEKTFNYNYTGKDIQSLNHKYNRNKTITSFMNTIHQNNTFQSFFWCIGYNGKLLSIIKNYFRPKYDYKKYNGYDPIIVSKTQRRIFQNILDKQNSDVNKFNCPKEYKLNNIYELIFKKLASINNNNGSQIIFFTSPIYNDKCKEDNIKLKKILNNKGFAYYDLTDFFKKENSIDYWKDETHLSKKGAEKFSEGINILLRK